MADTKVLLGAADSAADLAVDLACGFGGGMRAGGGGRQIYVSNVCYILSLFIDDILETKHLC